MLPKIPGYEIIEELGRGALGTVYKAKDPRDNKFVAVKFLIETMTGNTEAVKRFKREIRACLQLDHPNLIGAYTAGEVGGKWYYVMEYIEGGTAREEINRKGAFPEDAALEIGLRVAQALQHAANFNLVHRDIKPENIMLTKTGQVKLCDMGLAKSVDTEYQLTLQGTVLGTPHYMSPEQAQGEDLDFRSDIYSLGATIYHLLTGHPPFEGNNPLQVIRQVLKSPPVPPREHNPKVSEAATVIVSKMMAKKPEQRYQDLAVLIADIEKTIRQERTHAQESGHTSSFASTTPARDLQYDFCNVPSDEDMLFGRIALKNGLVQAAQIIPFLDRQEEAARVGANVRLADVMIVAAAISPAQKVAIDKARYKFEIDRANELFLKVAMDNRYIEPTQMAEVRKLMQVLGKDPAAILLDEGHIDERQREMVLAHQQKLIYWEEEKSFSRVAIDSQFITDKQAQKCRVIQSNRLVMGKYMDLGQVLVEREFMRPLHRDLLMRAIRRQGLCGLGIQQLITQKCVNQPA